jgi:hypothetical protein
LETKTYGSKTGPGETGFFLSLLQLHITPNTRKKKTKIIVFLMAVSFLLLEKPFKNVRENVNKSILVIKG